jgi:epidermal growth factor receptor substrate 15
MEKNDVRSAEKKYQTLIEERNKLNDDANAVKEERNNLNNEKTEMIKQMNELKLQRNKLMDEMRTHKKLRDLYHKKAKELIKERRERRGKIVFSLPEKVLFLRQNVQELEFKQQTVPMSIKKEKKIVDRIRKERNEIKDLEEKLKEQEKTEADITSISGSLDELFKKADEEHKEVIRLYNESQEYHEKMKTFVNEIAHLINEANKKHKGYLEIRERANKVHVKAMEMRNTVLVYKREIWKKKQEAKKDIIDQNIKVKKVLEDRGKLEKHAETALEKLLRKEKVSL